MTPRLLRHRIRIPRVRASGILEPRMARNTALAEQACSESREACPATTRHSSSPGRRMSPSGRTCCPAAGRGEQLSVRAHPDGVAAVPGGAAASCGQVALRLDLDLRRYADRDLPRRGGQDGEQEVTLRGTRVGLNAGARSSLVLQKTAERVLLEPHLPSQVCILLLAGPGVREDLALDPLGGGRSFRLPTPHPATVPEDRASTCSGCGRPTQKGSPLPRARVRWRPRVEQCLHQADATARPRRR